MYVCMCSQDAYSIVHICWVVKITEKVLVLQNCTVLYLAGFITNFIDSLFTFKLQADISGLFLGDVWWCVERTIHDGALLELLEHRNLGKRLPVLEA